MKNPKDLQKAIEDLISKNNTLTKQIEQFQKDRAKLVKSELKSKINSIGDVNFLGEIVELDGGSIKDISLLIFGFNLSNKISSGNTTINIKNQFINNKSIFEGDLRVYNGINFYEGSEVKKIYSNQLVSKVKNDIVQDQKIHFDQLKVEFMIDDYALKIKSLIANNYKIGITAKGMVNLKDNSFKINGMIVPGYFINNLFGIGKIPLIGGVVRGLFTGGEGGGLFGIKYEYSKTKDQKEAEFKTDKLSAFVPVTIRNLFD